MKVAIDKTFEKDTSRLRDKKLLNKIADCIENVQNVNSINEIANLKKLKGGAIYYRIRINNYRIGLIIKNNTATFIRFLHRKDIYAYFP